MSKRSRKSETKVPEAESEAKSVAPVAKTDDAPPSEPPSESVAPQTDLTLRLIQEILDAGGGVLLGRDPDGRLIGPSADMGAYERYAATTTIPDALRRQLALARRRARRPPVSAGPRANTTGLVPAEGGHDHRAGCD